MDKELWTGVESYINEKVVKQDKALEAALTDSKAAGLPGIQVTPNLGKLLTLMAKMIGARRILEIGTLGGYSTIWLARGLAQGGRLTTLELNSKHVEVARKNLARAGVAELVEIIHGPALETLPRLGKSGPFDLVFIDADKENTAEYVEWSLKMSRPGTVIIVDNVVRDGDVINAASSSPDTQGIRRLFDKLQNDHRLDTTAIQTVSSKRYDGVAFGIVR